MKQRFRDTPKENSVKKLMPASVRSHSVFRHLHTNAHTLASTQARMALRAQVGDVGDTQIGMHACSGRFMIHGILQCA
jgi:hypothetical protein